MAISSLASPEPCGGNRQLEPIWQLPIWLHTESLGFRKVWLSSQEKQVKNSSRMVKVTSTSNTPLYSNVTIYFVWCSISVILFEYCILLPLHSSSAVQPLLCLVCTSYWFLNITYTLLMIAKVTAAEKMSLELLMLSSMTYFIFLFLLF